MPYSIHDYLNDITDRSEAKPDCECVFENACPHCGRSGGKYNSQDHRDRCHKASVGE